MLPLFSRRSSRLSNGETESVKTMIVHDEGESDAGSTPCKDSTLIVRQVPSQQEVHSHISFHILLLFLSSVPSSSPPSVSIPFYVDVISVAMESSSASTGLCIK